MELENPPNRFDWTKSTVSIFYMPIIAHAFLISSKKNIPKSVIRSTGNIINLLNSDNNENGQKTYEKWLEKLVEYLNQNNNLKVLENNFKNDRYPSEKGPGHIKGKNQNKLLENIKIDGFGLDVIINSYVCERYKKTNNFILN